MPGKSTSSVRRPKRSSKSSSNKSIGGNVSTTRGQISTRKRGKSENLDDSFKERSVSAKTYSHWKPISKTSQALFIQTIDSAIISVLSDTSSVVYTNIQDVLDRLKHRTLEKSRNLRAPTTKRPKFGTLEAALQKLERDALEAARQEEQLSEMVESVTRIVQEKEELVEKLEKDIRDATPKEGETTELPPLLQVCGNPKLGIPPQVKTDHRLTSKPIPEVNKLVASLDGHEGLISVREYITELSDFVSTIVAEESEGLKD
ncbi:uncharacterized protein [Diadema setosum]|uniref:uncharacterized protein n=1 Tax=Diadema setosum TaxID=31175 RepID=UPI003B3AA96C